MIGELARKVRRQTKRVLGSHYLILEVEAVAWIHRGLTRQNGNVHVQHTRPYGVTVALVFREVELRWRFCNLRRDIFMLGKLRLAANAGICGRLPSTRQAYWLGNI